MCGAVSIESNLKSAEKATSLFNGLFALSDKLFGSYAPENPFQNKRETRVEKVENKCLRSGFAGRADARHGVVSVHGLAAVRRTRQKRARARSRLGNRTHARLS